MATRAFTPPLNWDTLLRRVAAYRERLTAPVDTIGCHCLLDRRAPKPVQRFQILVALMLSSQTRDEVTAEAMQQLIRVGLTPESINKMSPQKLNTFISKVGFHNNKTSYIKETANILMEKYNGTPPTAYSDIISLPGVGPKMAHLFLQAADGVTLGIGVDTHVHRIAQRFQWVPPTVKNPEDTRKALESWLPREHWSSINKHLVGLGQTVCSPLRPHCHECELSDVCPSAYKECGGSRGKNAAYETRKRGRVSDIEDAVGPERVGMTRRRPDEKRVSRRKK